MVQWFDDLNSNIFQSQSSKFQLIFRGWRTVFEDHEVLEWSLVPRPGGIMGWATSLANSLGVAEEGLRLILGQISGSYLFIKFFVRLAPRWLEDKKLSEYQTHQGMNEPNRGREKLE